MKKIIIILILAFFAEAHAAEKTTSKYPELERYVAPDKVLSIFLKYYHSYYSSSMGFKDGFTPMNHERGYDPSSRYRNMFKKKYKQYVKQLNRDYKNTRVGQKGKYGVTREEALKNGKINLVDNPNIHLTNLQSQGKLIISKTLAEKRLMAEDAKIDIGLLIGLGVGISLEPEVFQYKRNFRLEKMISKNIALVKYDLHDKEKNVTAIGHLLLMNIELVGLIESMYPKPNPIVWIGITPVSKSEKTYTNIIKHSISNKLAFGNNKETIIEGLIEKFGANSKDIIVNNKCNAASYSRTIRTGIALDNRHVETYIEPFSFMKNIYQWAGGDITTKIRDKYSSLVGISECTIKLNAQTEKLSISAILLPNYGLVELKVHRRINKHVPVDVFLKSAAKNWGEDYSKKPLSNSGVELKYKGMKVSLYSYKNTNTSTIEYYMDIDSHLNDMHEEIIRNNYYRGTKIRYFSNNQLQARYKLKSEITYKLIKAAEKLEEAIVKFQQEKKSTTADDLSL